jgi:hypothetical protein
MSQNGPLVIVGGNNVIGHYLMRRLAMASMTGLVISRKSLKAPNGFEVLKLDLNEASSWKCPEKAVIISFLPLWILAKLLPRFVGASVLIATGSTSRFSKQDSIDDNEREVANKLENAENGLKEWAAQNKVSWTLLRPTMIYDCETDKNITRMARFIRRWHFLPLAAPAKGLRQPIHSDDVAKAAFLCLNNVAVSGKAFNISGGEVLTYREMVLRVFASLDQKPRLLMFPTALLQKIFRLVAQLGLLKEKSFGSSIFQRMNEDLIFEDPEAIQLLNYAPRLFQPRFPSKSR